MANKQLKYTILGVGILSIIALIGLSISISLAQYGNYNYNYSSSPTPSPTKSPSPTPTPTPTPPPSLSYVPGNVNGDNVVDKQDLIDIFNTQLQLRPVRETVPKNPDDLCNPAADVNGSGRVTLDDGFYMLQYLFGGGPAPKPASASFSC